VRGRFTLHLPPGAHDLLQRCMDSDCGQIEGHGWTLSYDGGAMAGGGDSLVAGPDSTLARSCAEQIDGRRVFIRVQQFPDTGRSNLRGSFVGTATMRFASGYPLTLVVVTRSRRALQEFLAALRTFRSER